MRFVVLDKPAGVPVHAGPSVGPSLEDFFPQISRRKDGPWLAHRLDADTSGCLVIALRKAALLAAQAEFAAGRARKTYWAVVHGAPATDAGTIDAPLLRRTNPTGWRMVVDPTGQRAVTDWRVLGRGDGMSWLEFSPRTGRTHQIRVHAAQIGCPILGDAKYGPGTQDKMHLLARAITLDLTPPVTAQADPPAHMQAALARCGYRAPNLIAHTFKTGHNA